MTINDYIKDIHDYNIDINSRSIFLNNYPSIVDDNNAGVDHKMVSNFIKNLRILDSTNNSPILIHMHSIGGYLYDGFAIYDAIVACKSYVTIIVYGQAESTSSIILQAADLRIMMPSAYFMLHFGSTSYSANYLDVLKYTEFEKKFTNKMIEIYSNCIEKSKFFKETFASQTSKRARSYLLKKMHQGDWYLDAEETVYYGFADGVLGSKYYKTMDAFL